MHSHSLNVHALISSEANSLILSQSTHLTSYQVEASEGDYG